MKPIRVFAAAVAIALVGGLVGFLPQGAAAADVIVVPPGHLAKKAPKVYVGSRVLTGLGGGSFDSKYKKTYALLKKDQRLIANIKKAASIYGVDPVHIIGAIVGEHTYNIDTFDTLQTYYVKALQYADNETLQFAWRGETATELFARPQFARCEQLKSNYEKWDCRQTVWVTKFAGKSVDGKRFSPDRLHRVYFKPMYSGQTFGIGQLSPVAALMVTDTVHAKSGLPLLSVDNAAQVYEQIMNPDTSVHYMAAQIRVSIDMYKKIAGFDVSKNPGITATLYNLGNAATRARELNAINAERAAAGEPPQYPQENFYGWLVNDKEAELRALL